MTRRYCWRAGLAFEIADGAKCPECTRTDHRAIDDQNVCGSFANCGPLHGSHPFTWHDHGHPCQREPGNAGTCECPQCPPKEPA